MIDISESNFFSFLFLFSFVILKSNDFFSNKRNLVEIIPEKYHLLKILPNKIFYKKMLMLT